MFSLNKNTKNFSIFTSMKAYNKPNPTDPTKTNYNLSYNDYYLYGMLVPTRNYSNPVYHNCFQGKEKDDEIILLGQNHKIQSCGSRRTKKNLE